MLSKLDPSSLLSQKSKASLRKTGKKLKTGGENLALSLKKRLSKTKCPETDKPNAKSEGFEGRDRKKKRSKTKCPETDKPNARSEGFEGREGKKKTSRTKCPETDKPNPRSEGFEGRDMRRVTGKLSSEPTQPASAEDDNKKPSQEKVKNKEKDRDKEKSKEREREKDKDKGKEKEKLSSNSDDKYEEVTETQVLNMCKPMIKHKWYHGVMPRDEIKFLLEADGDFLIRKTTKRGRPIICLSVRHRGEIRHYPLVVENGQCFLKNMPKEQKFEEVAQLVAFLVEKRFQLRPSNALCVRRISRPDYYILHEDITLESKLGSGAYGEVWKARLRKYLDNNESIDFEVAVKRMKGNACQSKSLIAEFVKEAKLMRILRHQNIVTMHGVAPSEEPLMIVIELAANGCLRSYLKKNPTCPEEKMIQFTIDAARGMAYLSSQSVIHRDLAARNLLLGLKYEVKISDFGLSEHGKTESKAKKVKLPIRWLAPETCDTAIFTTKTDVWSFGVTLWEIFSHCETDPFPGMTNAQAKDLIRTQTPPMQPPDETPKIIVEVMNECFNKDPALRPTFDQILKKMSNSSEE